MEIKNKVFVVTGGGNGIGRGVVLHLLNEGASVYALDINEKGLEETKNLAEDLGDKLACEVCDVTDREHIETLPQKVGKQFGKVDGIINVAGIIQPFVKLNDLSYEKIEKIFDINFFGTLNMIKTFLPILLKSETTASIINIGSMAGFIPYPRQSIYGASKAAIKILSESLYSELKNTNVKVGVVFPGAVATDITKNSGVELKLKEGKKVKAMKMLSVDETADIILNTIRKEKYKVLAGKDSKMMDILYRIAPKKAIHIISKALDSYFED